MKKCLLARGVYLSLLILVILSSCGTTSVNRIESGTQPDLSGNWNAVDVKVVCDALISECLLSPLVDQAIKASGRRKPTVIVGGFRNETDEHINTEIIAATMETTIFNSGKLDFVVPPGATREALRRERQDQQSFASEETASRLGKEIGADFMLTGTVRIIVDREGNRTVRTYFVTAELTDIETNTRMWIGNNNQITKVITRPANRF